MVSRRQFLLGAGAGAAGLAVGAAGTLGVQDLQVAGPAAQRLIGGSRDAQIAENAGAAGPYGAAAAGRLGSRQVFWSARPGSRTAAITFDDGPSPEFTPRILDALDKADVKATFFAMGYNSAQHPELIREIDARGHEIGNHTWSHLDQTTLDAPEIQHEIVRCKDTIEQLIQKPLIGFRPPRGELTGYALMVCARLDYDTFMWSVTRGPGGVSTPKIVAQYVATTVEPGDIVDMHDGIGRGTFDPTASFAKALAARREVEVRALPTILSGLAARGIALTTVTDLVRGTTAGHPSA